jgi:hypothetical protein
VRDAEPFVLQLLERPQARASVAQNLCIAIADADSQCNLTDVVQQRRRERIITRRLARRAVISECCWRSSIDRPGSGCVSSIEKTCEVSTRPFIVSEPRKTIACAIDVTRFARPK